MCFHAGYHGAAQGASSTITAIKIVRYCTVYACVHGLSTIEPHLDKHA